MQYFVILFAIFAFLALAHGQKDPMCKNKPFAVGKCKQIITGYTFTPEKNGCSRFSTEGCRVTGNFFNTRQQCLEKCWDEYQDLVEFQKNLLNLLAEIPEE
ncbi:isoinhibitor K [Drosophila simulans]|uniref:BPTI/Kunitz inhibitor domain-containing protein n=1 Tax=Drosophila simulans TaxID=7240 RepID=A0A0J9QW43_DROSI|nr:isoinhibitor K [Drosophila simulans]KMY87939.1 uncharacterized protein Dsimw501_GD29275 [Drosophila simulans]